MRGDLLPLGEALGDALPIAAAALAGIVLGMMWYAKPAFGRPWMRLTGITEAQAKAFAPRGMAITAAGALVMALGIWWLVRLSGAATPLEGAVVGLFAGATIALAATGADVAATGRPMGLIAVNGLFHAVQGALMAFILAAWL